MAGVKATFQLQKCGGINIANHIDRSFESEAGENIDPKKIEDEKVYVYDSGKLTELPKKQGALAKSELEYYTKTFGHCVELQKQIYLKNRQNKRAEACTVEKYYNSVKTCPTGLILQVDKRGRYKDAEAFEKAVLKACSGLECNSEDARIKVLSASIHTAERSIHAHVRLSFEVKENGVWKQSTEKCLETLGYNLPFPSQKKDRYNNRKMEWTASQMTKWYGLVEKECGVELDMAPSPSNGLTKGKVRKTIFEMVKLQDQMEALETKLLFLKEQVAVLGKDEVEKQRKEIDETIESLTASFSTLKERIQPPTGDELKVERIFEDEEDEMDYE